MAFGSKLNQEILTPCDFDPNLLNNPARTTNFATKIEVQQPLLIWMGCIKKAAKAQYDASQLQWQRTKDYIVFETQKAYMQLPVGFTKALQCSIRQKKRPRPISNWRRTVLFKAICKKPICWQWKLG